MRRFDVKFWAGMGVSLFFMFLLFRKLDFHQLAQSLTEMDPYFIAAAILFTFASYFCRALRWRYLLIPVKTCGIRNLYSTTVIGYMANNILPARLGEFIRAYLLAEKEQVPSAPVFATLVIDRLFDGFALMIMLLITLFAMDFPAADMQGVVSAMRTAGIFTFAAYLAIIAFIVFLKLRTVRALGLLAVILKPFPAVIAEKLIPLLGSFISGIQFSRKMTHGAWVLISTLFIWIFALIPIDLVFQSSHISLPFNASIFIMVLLVFAVMVPASPGYIGTYHYACYKGLSVFHIAGGKAMGLALVMHAISFFPVIIVGLYYLWRDKISLSTARRQQGERL